MLSSIHPLGERARHNRWGLTVAAHAAGSWLGAVAVFGLAGAAGAVVDVPGWVAVPAAVVALVLDWRALRGGAEARIPGPRRQVNEDWLNRYRGWVYGAGFGMQLGAAVLTIVTSAAVYLALVLTVLVGSWWAGLVVGSVYGIVRTLPLFGARRVQASAELAAMHQQLRRRARPVQVASTVALGVLAVGLAVGVTAGAAA